MNSVPDALKQYILAQKPMYGMTDYQFGGYFHLEPLEDIEKLRVLCSRKGLTAEV
jgi:hypothetical protein